MKLIFIVKQCAATPLIELDQAMLDPEPDVAVLISRDAIDGKLLPFLPELIDDLHFTNGTVRVFECPFGSPDPDVLSVIFIERKDILMVENRAGNISEALIFKGAKPIVGAEK
jgi:hypothetical protein